MPPLASFDTNPFAIPMVVAVLLCFARTRFVLAVQRQNKAGFSL
jgi:hypothetical protein